MKRYHDRMNETWLYDHVNKLNNISQHKFRFLKYFDTFLSKKKIQGRERKILSY